MFSTLKQIIYRNLSKLTYHPNPIKVSHLWVVPHLELSKSKKLHNIHDWPHLRDIKIPTNNYDVTVLIGADKPQLYLQELGKELFNCCKNNVRLGANGRKNSVNIINTNRLVTNENINLD